MLLLISFASKQKKAHYLMSAGAKSCGLDTRKSGAAGEAEKKD
jgi:hypothetical protein